jgi:hypothetical protein
LWRSEDFAMRTTLSLFAIPAIALATPASAQDVVFVAGTGVAADTRPGGSYDEPYVVADSVDATLSRDEGIDAVADRMSDPAMQDSIAYTVEQMASAVLALPVGGIAEAIETARPGTVRREVRHDTTVGDFAGRDGDYIAEDLGDRSREMVGMMGSLARAAATMAPAIAKMGRNLEESYRSAKRDAHRR